MNDQEIHDEILNGLARGQRYRELEFVEERKALATKIVELEKSKKDLGEKLKLVTDMVVENEKSLARADELLLQRDAQIKELERRLATAASSPSSPGKQPSPYSGY